MLLCCTPSTPFVSASPAAMPPAPSAVKEPTTVEADIVKPAEAEGVQGPLSTAFWPELGQVAAALLTVRLSARAWI